MFIVQEVRFAFSLPYWNCPLIGFFVALLQKLTMSLAKDPRTHFLTCRLALERFWAFFVYFFKDSESKRDKLLKERIRHHHFGAGNAMIEIIYSVCC